MNRRISKGRFVVNHSHLVDGAVSNGVTRHLAGNVGTNHKCRHAKLTAKATTSGVKLILTIRPLRPELRAKHGRPRLMRVRKRLGFFFSDRQNLAAKLIEIDETACLNRTDSADGLTQFISKLNNGVIAVDGEWGLENPGSRDTFREKLTTRNLHRPFGSTPLRPTGMTTPLCLSSRSLLIKLLKKTKQAFAKSLH